jgi:hypothetical protein
MAACDLFRYMTLGEEGYHDNCSDNLRMAMMAIGEPVTHVPQPFNIWMNIPVHPDWSVEWKAPRIGARRVDDAARRDGLHRRNVGMSAGHDPDQRRGHDAC